MKLSMKKIAIIALLHAINFSCKGMEKGSLRQLKTSHGEALKARTAETSGSTSNIAIQITPSISSDFAETISAPSEGAVVEDPLEVASKKLTKEIQQFKKEIDPLKLESPITEFNPNKNYGQVFEWLKQSYEKFISKEAQELAKETLKLLMYYVNLDAQTALEKNPDKKNEITKEMKKAENRLKKLFYETLRQEFDANKALIRVLYYKDNMYTMQKQIIKPDNAYAMPIPIENPKSGGQRNKQAPEAPKKVIHWAQRITKPERPVTNQPYRPMYTSDSTRKLYNDTQEAIQNLNKEKSELLTQHTAALRSQNLKKAVCITDQIRELDKKIANKEKVRMAAEKLLTVLEKKQKPTSGEEQKVPVRRLSLTPSLQGPSPEVFTQPAPDLSKLLLLEECKSS